MKIDSKTLEVLNKLKELADDYADVDRIENHEVRLRSEAIPYLEESDLGFHNTTQSLFNLTISIPKLKKTGNTFTRSFLFSDVHRVASHLNILYHGLRAELIKIDSKPDKDL